MAGVVITAASSKGGVGKTMTACLLTGELARQGATVAAIDGDPNQHLAKWIGRGGLPDKITLYADANEDNMTDLIIEAKESHQFVIIDIAGIASMTLTYAVIDSDLVIIPFQMMQDDVDEAGRTISRVFQCGKAAGRSIPYSLLRTRTSPAIEERTARAFVESLHENKLDLFKTTLVDRAAFRTMRSVGGLVNDLTAKQVSNVEAAASNVNALAAEVVEKVKEIRKAGRGRP